MTSDHQSCWICGDAAHSREHIPKASDVRRYLGVPSQQSPLYFHTTGRKNVPVQGIRSERFRSKAPICAKCNNERTQPYDKAWEQLSAYLDANSQPLSRKGAFNLARIFRGGSFRKHARNVHLFFVKLFGCRIAESGAPIELARFKESLLTAVPHPNIVLAFHISTRQMPVKLVQIGAIHAAERNNMVISAGWEYSIGQICVIVAYHCDEALIRPYPRSWHPEMPNRVIQLARTPYWNAPDTWHRSY